MTPPPAAPGSRLRAILRLRCPRCFEGRVFAKPFTMAEACSACGLVYGYEQGYLFGGLFIGIPFGLLVLALSGLILWRFHVSAAAVCAVFILEFKASLLLAYHWTRALYLHLEFLGGRFTSAER